MSLCALNVTLTQFICNSMPFNNGRFKADSYTHRYRHYNMAQQNRVEARQWRVGGGGGKKPESDVRDSR